LTFYSTRCAPTLNLSVEVRATNLDIDIPSTLPYSYNMSTTIAPARYTATDLGAVIQRQGRKVTWLAEQVGVSHALISLIAAGRRSASARDAEAIARVLNVDMDDIFRPGRILDAREG
jgi:hypothetical protein